MTKLFGILICLCFGIILASRVTSFSWPTSTERVVRIDDIQIDGVRKAGGIVEFTFPATLTPTTGGPMGPGESVTKSVTYSLTEGASSNLKTSDLQAKAQSLEVSCRGPLKETCYVLSWEHPATIRFVFERTTE